MSKCSSCQAHHPLTSLLRCFQSSRFLTMNRTFFNKSGASLKKKGSKGENESISSGSSYGSASSARSAASNLAAASSLATTQGVSLHIMQLPTSRLPPPCHLNCGCDDCRKPNAQFLDSLLNLTPPANAGAEGIVVDDPLGLLLADMGDFSL